MDNPRFLYTNIFDEEFLHIVCRFMFLERVLKKKNYDGINVAKERCMPLFYGLFALRRFSGIQYC